ncbi:chemotaxis response regulator protein-glutamate methylesterase [Pseudomonas aeruginosa]|nr:chemotaxis response regulator protein-glutamate methylesterase [Pseudomonas aeruginosa]ELQ7318124.1 chemotaxis response regulator protein-glutamate methylesterase [Pseudomonas aeruginosa]ELQ7329309.1 chemotaxis response regulator protein-glutamate methylesterase [Pseudomonas aeruginosa]ELQ7336459.1 chemotaxis response regulator protein-glutamate methylesterase [Pseudomonas aeruginosa]ELQ7342653.1 chemotaxis response regulator protein-glutamate methylesterase [Pseudomonas aeruginosa]
MRIGIVNDMPLAVEALRRALAFEPQHQIVWVASNGAEAVTQCAADTPDVVLMDLLMPVMDGVEATRRIMAESPCAIVIVTVDIEQNVHRVFEAMGYGALDAVNTPALGIGNPQTAAAPLLRKIQNVGWLIGQRDNRGKVQVVPPKAGGARQRLVAIGASAGGPASLAVLLKQLPASFNAAVVLVQHVDEVFAAGMAEWLVYTAEPRSFVYRPSIDVFFESVANYWRGDAVGVLLTGMGRDGAQGLKQMRERGFLTIAQDQASCAVYGMPKAAAAIDAAVQILSLEKIAPRLAEVFD